MMPQVLSIKEYILLRHFGPNGICWINGIGWKISKCLTIDTPHFTLFLR